LKDKVTRRYGTAGTPGTAQKYGTHPSQLPSEIKVADHAELVDKICELSRQGWSIRQIASVMFFVGGKDQILSKSGVGRILKKAASVSQIDVKQEQQQQRQEVAVPRTSEGRRSNRTLASLAFELFDKGRSPVDAVKKLGADPDQIKKLWDQYIDMIGLSSNLDIGCELRNVLTKLGLRNIDENQLFQMLQLGYSLKGIDLERLAREQDFRSVRELVETAINFYRTWKETVLELHIQGKIFPPSTLTPPRSPFDSSLKPISNSLRRATFICSPTLFSRLLLILAFSKKELASHI
jgi:hypothetical protein